MIEGVKRVEGYMIRCNLLHPGWTKIDRITHDHMRGKKYNKMIEHHLSGNSAIINC